VGISISAIFIFLVLIEISITELKYSFAIVNKVWVFIALCSFLLGYICRIWRWKFMLLIENPHLTWIQCSIPFMASVATNNILPFRAGDVLRAFGFSKFLGIKSTSILTTLIIERMLDLLMLLSALGMVFLFLANHLNVGMNFFSGFTIISIFIFLVFLFSMLMIPKLIEIPLYTLLNICSYKFPKIVSFLIIQTNKIFNNVKKQTKKLRMLILIGCSIIIWLFEAGVFYSIACALPGLSNPISGLFAMPIGTLSTMIPSSPGYVGTFHYFVIQAIELFDNTATTAAAFAILVHLMLWFPATLWGGISFLFWLYHQPRLKS